MMKSIRNSRKQRGVVLYVALIILVLLALIGIVAMQVATLQERMSSNYMTTSMAFQNAEASARQRETQLKTQVAAGETPTLNLAAKDCSPTFDPSTWTSTTPHTRRLDLCFSWGGLDLAVDEAEKTDQIYEVTVFSYDNASTQTAEAVIDTVFIP